MKTRKILTALSLAIALANTNPMISLAYSDKKLNNFEDSLEDHINKEINTEKYNTSTEDTFLESYNRYRRIQELIRNIPTEYYYDLVDNINTSKTLKKVLKACIDDNMYDVAKESIVYANIAENEQEVLFNIMTFFESRDNGNEYIPNSGKLKDNYFLEDIHTFDNCDDITNIQEEVLIFRDFTSYGDYRIYDTIDFESYYGDTYYIITNQDNKVLACVKQVEKVQEYLYLEPKEIYIASLEDCLKENNLDEEIKSSYTYGELEELNPRLKKKNNNIGLTLEKDL